MDVVVSADGTGPSRSPGRSILFFTFYLGTLAALGPLAIDMYLPAFPKISESLGTTVPAMQRTLATYFIGLAVGQLIYGPVADRLGRRGPLLFGLALFTLASGLCAMAWSVHSLMALRVLQALGGCAEMVIARAIVRDLFDDRDSAKLFSSLVLVMGLAPILAPLAGGFIAVTLGWRFIFGVLALAGAATFASTILFYRESLPPERRQRHSAGEVARVYGRLLLDGPFMGYTLSTGFVLAALFAYVGGSPHVFQEIFHIPEERFGLYFGPIACGIIGMSQVNGWLVSRFDLRRILRIAHFVNTLAGLVLLVTAHTGFGGFWAIYFPLWVVIASCGFIFPNATVLAMSPHGRNAGNASALLGSIQFGISALGGAIVSTLQNGTAVPMAATIAICTGLALAIHLSTRAAPVKEHAPGEAEGTLLAAE